MNFCEIAFDESPLLWIFSDKNRNNENQIRPQTNVLFGISDEQVDDWLASFDDENDDSALTDKDNCKKNSNEKATAESKDFDMKNKIENQILHDFPFMTRFVWNCKYQ